MNGQPKPEAGRRRNARGIAPAWLFPASLALVLLSSSQAFAQGTLAEIEDIWQKGLYEESFSLRRDVDVTVEVIGSGDRDSDALLAYAWILDLGARKVVWHMDARRSRKAEQEDNLQQIEDLRLPAGDYTLYFSAIGGSFPVRKAIRILDLLNLGTVSIKGGNYTRWNELGNPREWRATIRMADGGNVDDVLIRPPRTPELQAILRLDRMGDGAFRRARVEVSKPVRLRVLAVGEYAADDLGFADGAWIEDADECSRAWEMTLVNTVPAGGAQKNRVYDNLILLEPGNYLACYGTDDSHAYDEWNAPPPYDPESWGLTLIPEAPLAPGTVKVTLDPAEKNLIAQIAQVGDSQYREQEFYLSHPAQVCIRAYGEWDAKQGRYYDFGWIEDAYTLRPVWTMETNPGHYASGEARNRMVEEKLALEPGLYRVAYVTDNGHAYGNWSSHPPFEPAAWGIRLCGLGEEFSMQWVSDSAPQKDSPALIRLAPLESGVHKRVRFRVDGPTRVKLIAMGEGDDGDMYDYGWLVDEDSGETIWKMKYEDTQPAGGARKNRRVEHELTLQPGTYSLNATTDGSHAFGDWNDDVPRDFHRWGITLVEVASR